MVQLAQALQLELLAQHTGQQRTMHSTQGSSAAHHAQHTSTQVQAWVHASQPASQPRRVVCVVCHMGLTWREVGDGPARLARLVHRDVGLQQGRHTRSWSRLAALKANSLLPGSSPHQHTNSKLAAVAAHQPPGPSCAAAQAASVCCGPAQAASPAAAGWPPAAPCGPPRCPPAAATRGGRCSSCSAA